MTETPAATIRRAAALMRERAEAVPHGPWHWQAFGEHGYPQRVYNEGAVIVAESFTGPDARMADAEYIAAMGPEFALAVADWLEASAKAHEGTSANTASYSLKIALAYLGEPMP